MTEKECTRGSGPRDSRPAAEYDAHRSAVAAAAYVATELATTPPQRLQMVLYDSAIRMCRQAVEALDAGQLAHAAERLGRARAIIVHLQAQLGPTRHSQVTSGAGSGGPVHTQAAPDLARELAELFRQVHRRLIEADYYRKRQTVEESIQLLHHRRGALTAFLHAASHGAAGHVQASSWVG